MECWCLRNWTVFWVGQMNEEIDGKCSQNVHARPRHCSFRQRQVQQGYWFYCPLAPQAADGANLICEFGPLRPYPTHWIAPVQATVLCAGVCCTRALHPSMTHGPPSAMQLTGACRLRGSSSPCSCWPCLAPFLSLPHAQKPSVRRYASRIHWRGTAT